MTTAPQMSRNEKLIGLEPLLEIVETALFTAHLHDTIPMSCILIGPSGGGKSKAIMQYKESNGCHLTNDITSSGLLELLSGDHEQKINFLIVPDFNVVLSHKTSTLQLTIANLLPVTSEGTVRCDDGRLKKETKHNPVGILTAMTRDLYEHVARKWQVLGFQRRFLPLYFEYGIETRLKIQDSIAQGATTLLQLLPRSLTPPLKKVDVNVADMSQRIQAISNELAENIGYVPVRGLTEKRGKFKSKTAFVGKQLEFSPHLALRSFARAHALKNKRNHVTSEDFDFLVRLMRYTRYDRPGVL
jgi:hypothetical protein